MAPHSGQLEELLIDNATAPLLAEDTALKDEGIPEFEQLDMAISPEELEELQWQF